MTISELQHEINDLLGRLPADMQTRQIAGQCLMRLPGNHPPWQSTGVRVRHGQSFSLFASGRIQWSKHNAERYGGPSFHLWARVAPHGEIMNLTADTGTFVADTDGVIELGIYMGVWKNAFGELATPRAMYDRLSGALHCWIVAWIGEPEHTLTTLLRFHPTSTWLHAALQHLKAPRVPPAGWRYLLETGTAEIFTHGIDALGRSYIALDARDEQGIITTAVDFPLTPDTTLHWRWRGEQLPSETAENTIHAHDYFSIATEFDNGRDLTWIWSCALAPGTHFRCPFPPWSSRETHLVVRTGTAGLGTWHTQCRNVYDDVTEAMGPPPTRIVKVWLIGIATFQHQRASAFFSDIELRSATHRLTVL